MSKNYHREVLPIVTNDLSIRDMQRIIKRIAITRPSEVVKSYNFIRTQDRLKRPTSTNGS
jgi:hypothetical protein